MPVKKRDPQRIEIMRLFVRLESLREAGEESVNALKRAWIDEQHSSSPMKRVLASMVPTFLFMQVHVLFEDFINLLWKTRYPELEKTRQAHFSEKLRILADLHEFQPSTFKSFQDKRNKFAHQPREYASWEEFEDYEAEVSSLAFRVYKRAYRRKRKVSS